MTTQNLNPVRIMTVQDWKQLAELELNHFEPKELWISHKATAFQERYESEVFKTLERKHFVCDVEKPQCYEVVRAELAVPSQSQYDLCVDYDNAQSDLVFEGKMDVLDYMINLNEQVHLFFRDSSVNSLTVIKHTIYKPTIFDLIYHISKYNETATNKIELKFTEAFIKKIIQ